MMKGDALNVVRKGILPISALVVLAGHHFRNHDHLQEEEVEVGQGQDHNDCDKINNT